MSSLSHISGPVRGYFWIGIPHTHDHLIPSRSCEIENASADAVYNQEHN